MFKQIYCKDYISNQIQSDIFKETKMTDMFNEQYLV